MQTDSNPNFPVKAKLLGGPSHDKLINLEEDSIKDGYTVIEGSLFAHHVPPPPHLDDNKTRECKYVYWKAIDENGRFKIDYSPGSLALFVPETLLAPGAWRSSALLQEASEKLTEAADKHAETLKKLDDTRADLEQADEENARLEEELDALRALTARGRRFAIMARALLDDSLDATEDLE